ncbi:hypothetical protein [Abyssisolibacter fermentans]|uniref:hypothetical protein n=1 Tax=Abyssisolibacter fermentans TaxID=1766203 RepID=UPI0012E3EF12|nr:hypothetical protein [Abyssisolibacter fermentans]
MTWKKALRKINKVASIAKDVEAIASGDSKKITKRAKNKAKAKVLAKSNLWKW